VDNRASVFKYDLRFWKFVVQAPSTGWLGISEKQNSGKYVHLILDPPNHPARYFSRQALLDA
jgi:hypothetical protein